MDNHAPEQGESLFAVTVHDITDANGTRLDAELEVHPMRCNGFHGHPDVVDLLKTRNGGNPEFLRQGTLRIAREGLDQTAEPHTVA